MAQNRAAASIWKDGWAPGAANPEAAPAPVETAPLSPPPAASKSSDSENKHRHNEKKAGPHPALPSRPRPKTLADTGIPEVFIADPMLKHCFYLNFFYHGRTHGAGEIWDDVILIPYALYEAGNVIRVSDEISQRQWQRQRHD